MVRMKQTKRKSDDKGKLPVAKRPRQPSKLGTAHQTVTHGPLTLPADPNDCCGNPSYLSTFLIYLCIYVCRSMYLCMYGYTHVEDVKSTCTVHCLWKLQ